MKFQLQCPQQYYWNTASPAGTYYLWLFHVTTAELKSCDRLCGPQSLKYLPSDPLQKNSADSRFTEQIGLYAMRQILKSLQNSSVKTRKT